MSINQLEVFSRQSPIAPATGSVNAMPILQFIRLYAGSNWLTPTSEQLHGGKVYGAGVAGTDYTLTIVAPGTKVLVTQFTWGADVPIVGTLRLNTAKIAQFGGYGGYIEFPYGVLGGDGDDIIGRIDFVTGACNVAMNVHYYLI